MPRPTDNLALDVDLEGGMVPISKAASSLAALIKRCRERGQPIVVTQKGYPTGVLLPIELFVALRERAECVASAADAKAARLGDGAPLGELTAVPAVPAAPAPESVEQQASAEPAPQPKARGGRRAKQPAVAEPAPEPVALAISPVEDSPQRKARGGRKAKAQP